MVKKFFIIFVLILLCACAQFSEKPEQEGLPFKPQSSVEGTNAGANKDSQSFGGEAEGINPGSIVNGADEGNGESQAEDAEIERFIAKMPLEEKIGQMFMVAYRKGEGGNITALNGQVAESVEKYRPGGVILFSENIKDYEQVKAYIGQLQEISGIPLLIGVDEEGGRVSRLNGIIETLPPAGDIGKKNDAEYTYSLGASLGASLADLGFNVNFSPVCDIDVNLNSVVGNRAFGRTPDIVSLHSAQIIKGLQDNGVGAAAKHFPGHGGTKEDSHKKMAVTYASIEDLRKFELVPFENAVKAEVSMVMVGHISAPEVTGNYEPAVFSGFLIKGILRNEMGFEGIVITDAMEMGAIAFYTQEEAAVRAVKAGVDIILMPSDLDKAYSALLEAAASGEIKIEQINSSVGRIIKYKMKYLDWKADAY